MNIMDIEKVDRVKILLNFYCSFMLFFILKTIPIIENWKTVIDKVDQKLLKSTNSLG